MFADKHCVVRTVRLKLESERNAEQELVRPVTKIVLLVEDNSQQRAED